MEEEKEEDEGDYADGDGQLAVCSSSEAIG